MSLPQLFRRRFLRRTPVRTSLVLFICAILMFMPLSSLLRRSAAAASGAQQERMGNPKPGAPEGVLPNLNQAKRRPQAVTEPRPPIPSTIRSKKIRSSRGTRGFLCRYPKSPLKVRSRRQPSAVIPENARSANSVVHIMLEGQLRLRRHHLRTIRSFRISSPGPCCALRAETNLHSGTISSAAVTRTARGRYNSPPSNLLDP